jgi:hypothetical protein
MDYLSRSGMYVFSTLFVAILVALIGLWALLMWVTG